MRALRRTAALPAAVFGPRLPMESRLGESTEYVTLFMLITYWSRKLFGSFWFSDYAKILEYKYVVPTKSSRIYDLE